MRADPHAAPPAPDWDRIAKQAAAQANEEDPF
jgi:hypothetical protein